MRFNNCVFLEFYYLYDNNSKMIYDNSEKKNCSAIDINIRGIKFTLFILYKIINLYSIYSNCINNV